MLREFQLILESIRSQPDVKSVRNLVNEGINWQILLNLAEQHGVRPMLFRILKSVCWDAVPQASQLELERFNTTNVEKNLVLTGELLRLIDILAQHAIPTAT